MTQILITVCVGLMVSSLLLTICPIELLCSVLWLRGAVVFRLSLVFVWVSF